MNSQEDPKTLMHPQMLAARGRAAELAREAGPPGDGIEGVRDHALRARAWWNEGGPEIGEVRDLSVPGPFRDTPVRLYRPTRGTDHMPVFVFLHGGGYKIGSPTSNDRQMRELVSEWGGIVISADYAHLPEHVFPDAVEETASLYRWLADNGERWGIDSRRIAFGGTSAGGNVSLGAAIALGGADCEFLRTGVMICAVMDRELDTESMRRFGGPDMFPSRDGAAQTQAEYTPDPADRHDPRTNCIAAHPNIIPPLYIAAAEIDCFADSSRRMAAHLAAADRPHVLKVYAGMTHLFFGMSRMVDGAAECVSDVAAWLTENV